MTRPGRSSHSAPVVGVVARPDGPGQGGVVRFVEAVVPHVEGVDARRLRLGRHPSGRPSGWSALRSAGACDVLLLNITVRPRAFARDLAFSCAARRPYAVHLHGMSGPFAQRLAGVPGVGRWMRSAARVFSLCPAHEAWLHELGVDSARVVRTTTCFDAACVPVQRSTRRKGQVLYLGRIVPGKGLRRLLDALEHLGPDAPRAVVGGGGALLPSLRATARQRGLDVEFPGWVAGPRKRELLASSSVAVLFSDDEACPVFALEALASGCHLVASDAGALPELVGTSGQVLSRSASASDLAGALSTATPVSVEGASAARRAYHPQAVGVRLGRELVAATRAS